MRLYGPVLGLSLLLLSGGVASAASESLEQGAAADGRMVIAQVDPATAATAAAAGAGAAISGEVAEKAAVATEAAADKAGEVAQQAVQAGAEAAQAATEAASDAADAAVSSGAVQRLNKHMVEAKRALDDMVQEVIVSSGLEKMDLTPNQVYGIAIGAVAGAFAADAMGATGLATLGVAAVAAFVGGYVTGDTEMAEAHVTAQP